MRSIVIVFMAIVFSLAGCNKIASIVEMDNPSEADARAVVMTGGLKKLIDSGDITIDGFKKLDGVIMEKNGIKFYTMKVEFTIKYPKGLDCSGIYAGINTNLAKCLAVGSKKIMKITPGYSITSAHEMVFEKTETGWHAINFS